MSVSPASEQRLEQPSQSLLLQDTEAVSASRQTSATAGQSASPTSRDVEQRIDVPIKEDDVSAKQVREVVRLWQCQICSLLFTEPITLPCGRNLCQKCLPETHVRTNISYPPRADRLRGFTCPFTACGRSHVIGDCGVDVTLKKTLALVTTQFDSERQKCDSQQDGITTQIVITDEWQATEVTRIEGLDHGAPRVIAGGRLMATYTLAKEGKLPYAADVVYTVSKAEGAEDLDDPGGGDFELLKNVKAAVRTEMDCQVCYALYCDPYTTPCGHTFCRSCLHRILDHAPHCPVCRRALQNSPSLFGPACPSNDTIIRVTTAFWADELHQRKAAVLADGNLLSDAEFDIPIFVCALAFPEMPTFLHVFEPRYRLMIRRALEGDRVFGMVAYQRARNGDSANFVELGTLLEIMNVEFYPDGRSIIETRGISRFRIVRHGTLDGYVVGKIERITDITIAEEEELEANETRHGQGVQTFMAESEDGNTRSLTNSPNSAPLTTGRRNPLGPSSLADLETMATSELMDYVLAFVQRMHQQSATWLATRILQIYGDCPTDPAVFPWWFASILPVRDMQKYRLLSTTSVRERLKICCGWALEWQGNRW
jgi:hypothetical protein